jgi:DNA-binding winged helix-turn-helix (wHTH) protein
VRVRFADFHLDTEARQIRRGTKDLHLSPKAFELLKVLVENRPRALAKQELLDKIWPGVFVSEASLARAVSEIRDAIDEHSRNDGFLQTVHAFGYRFATEGVIELGEGASPGDGPACWLIGKDREYRLSDGDQLIGREVGVAIRLDSPKVSRNHARIVVSGRDVLIEDLSSKNGTFVRGSRIEAPTSLDPGDEIQIGPVRLRLRIDEQPGNTLTEAWTRDG